MARIKCPECGKEVSDKAKVCPNCAYPIAELNSSKLYSTYQNKNDSSSKEFDLGQIAVCILLVIVVFAIFISIMSQAASLGAGPYIIWFIIWMIYAFICGIVAKHISKERRISGGFWWGFFLGVIGIIVVAVRPRDK